MKREDFAAMIPENDKYVGSNIYLNGKNAGFEECLQMIKENMDNLKCANCKCFSKNKNAAFIIFIAVIASFVQLVEMVVEKFSPSLYASLGIFLPLIAVNCAILGGSLFMQQKAFPNVGVATVYGLGSGIGWLLAIVGMAAIREKLAYSDIPKPLKGLGITFIITGLMGMAFMCFSGLKI